MDPYNRDANPIPPTETSFNITNSNRTIVDHTYRDFSCFLLKGGEVPRHKKSGANFPAKLHQMLSDDECSDIITWMPHGRAFKILDKELLVSVMIPKYLSQTKFESFTRQLSGWGFKRLHQSGPDYGSYYHECFLLGIPLITGLMRRAETNQGKPIPNPEEEPNFYYISSTYPLPPTQDGGSLTSATLQAGDRTPSFLMAPGSQSGHAMSTYQSLPDMQSYAPRMRSTSDAQYPTSSLPRDSSSIIPAAMLTTSSSYSSVPNMHCNEYDNAAQLAQNPMLPIRQQYPMYAPYPAHSYPPINGNSHYYGSSYHDNHSTQWNNYSHQVAVSTARSHCHDNQAHLAQHSNQSGSKGIHDHSIPTTQGTVTVQLDIPRNEANAGKEQGTQNEDDEGDFHTTMNEFMDNFDF